MDGVDGQQNLPGQSSSLWYRLNKVITRLCSTHQFKNLQVEMLYQRYFLRMNQNNTTHIVSLLLALVLLLASIHIIFALIVASSVSPSTSTSGPSAAVKSSEVVRLPPSPAFSGNNIEPSAVMLVWDNETSRAMGARGVVADVSGDGDNTNFTALSSADNMTTWDLRNETMTTMSMAEGGTSVEQQQQQRDPNKTQNVLALIVTLGICGTICICTYAGRPQITLN